MFALLVEKELKLLLLSPKFTAMFAVCSILVLLSLYIEVKDYQLQSQESQSANNLAEQFMRDETNWQSLQNHVHLKPDPMLIFVAGVHNDIGQYAGIRANSGITLENSNYTQNPLFSLFRFLDLAYFIQVILPLFAIALAYDAISGERESGTLKLNFANALPRNYYILAKFAGSWLALVLPLLIPMLLGLLLVQLYQIPMTILHWQQLGAISLLAIPYFTFYICLSLFVSSLVRHSSTAFLILLVLWLLLVFFIPRIGVMTAGQVIDVPGNAEINSELNQRSIELNAERQKKFDLMFKDLNSRSQSLKDSTPEEQKQISQELNKLSREKQQEFTDEYNAGMEATRATLQEEVRNRKNYRQDRAFMFARLSPSAAFQLGAMELAGSGADLKADTEQQLLQYRNNFTSFVTAKVKEASANDTMNAATSKEKLDISQLPRYQNWHVDLPKAIANASLDFLLICVYMLIAMGLTFFTFSRYDVR